MHRYEAGGSDPAFNFTNTFDEVAGGWELLKVQVFREGESLASKDHHAAYFSAKVLAIWHGVAECEVIAQLWRAGKGSAH